MTERKSSPEKNEVPAPCPPCPPVSRGEEGRECRVGEGRRDHDSGPSKEAKEMSLKGTQPLGTRKNLGLGIDLLLTAV